MYAMELLAPQLVDEADPLVLAESPDPQPGPGQVRIRIRACGVCHTDLHTVEGELDLPLLPLVPGHQVVGVIDACGPGVAQWAPGDRVGVPWLHATCGHCGYCGGGRENLCDHARFTGLHVHGGYADVMLAEADFVCRLPDGFSDEQAAPLLCAGIIGYRALRLSGIAPGQRLALFGFGASAHIAIQVARHWDCQVYVFSRSPEHRQHAAALGARWVGGPDEAPPHPVHSAINFTPSGAVTLAALRVLAKGGTVAMAGIHSSPLPPIDYHLLYGERTIRSVANATRQDAEDLLSLASTIPIHTHVEVFSLFDEANQTLRRLKRSQIQGAAVLKV